MAIDDLSFCSSCLICTKLCVHPKARLKLNDCHLPTSPKKTVPSVNRKQVLSFTKCVSKFCELFNFPPDDDDFARDFSDFFKFTTLSQKCQVCEDCRNRIRLISKVMIQIETLQAQLETLKNSVDNDLISTNLPSPHRSDELARNKVNKRFIVDVDTKAGVFREQLRRKLQVPLTAGNPVDIDDEPSAVSSDPNTNSILFDGAIVETNENDNGLNLFCDDEYFDVKPDPDDGEGLNGSIDDCIDLEGELQSEWENEIKVDADVETKNEVCDRTNTHNIYASVEIKGATSTLTLSNLEEPVIIDNLLKEDEFDDEMHDYCEESLTPQSQTEANYSSEMTEIAFANKGRSSRARIKSLKMSKDRSSSNDKLKCTFVDPVKGACRVTVLDQDRLNAHFNRTHKNIPEDIAFECNLCPFATGSIKHLNLHRIQHAGNKFTTCEASVSIPDTDCYDQLRQPSDQEKEEITSEIEFDFDTEIQSSDDSDSADVNPIAGITNREAEDVAQTLNVIQLGEPNNLDADLIELQNTEKIQVSVSKTNRHIPESKAFERGFEPGSNWHAEESDNACIKKTKGHHAQNKRTNKPPKNPEKKRKYFKCTFVEPVKGECKVRALHQDGLDAHINRFHKKIPRSKSFQCNLCPFATGDIRKLVKHKQRHTGINDVTCEICGRSFHLKEYLVKHKRAKHDEPYPVHCNICGKGCHNFHGLKMHNLQNHGEGEFTHRCLVCNEGFYTLPQLNSHMVKHAERNFKCNECPKAFRTKGLLKRHVETHTGIRPFACDLCSWKFYTQHKLDVHRSIHTKKRPFLCQECGFSCRLQELLTSHLKVHENNKSLAEKGIKNFPRLAKPRNIRLKNFENTVTPTIPIANQTTTETPAKIIIQQVESEISKE